MSPSIPLRKKHLYISHLGQWPARPSYIQQPKRHPSGWKLRRDDVPGWNTKQDPHLAQGRRFNCWELWQESGYGRGCNIWSVTWDRIWDLTSQLLICPTSKLGIYHLAIKHSNGTSSFIDEFSHLMPIYSWFPIAMFDYWRVYQVVYLGLDIYIYIYIIYIYIHIIIWVYNGDIMGTYMTYIYIYNYMIFGFV